MAVTEAAFMKTLAFMFLVLTTAIDVAVATWCVVRSDASNQALQAALDYACGAGADCAPIQSNGLCYLPNTVQAHAAYAFNSYYQRSGNVPYSCSFAGTATIARTDPSYGSCTYPSSPRNAGGRIGQGGINPIGTTTKGTGTRLATSEPTPPGASTPNYTGHGGFNTGLGQLLPEPHVSNSACNMLVEKKKFRLIFLFAFVLIYQTRCL